MTTAAIKPIPLARETFETFAISASTLNPGALGDRLGASLDRMIAIQMEAYPSSWSEADRREMAIAHLFASAS